ncbi:hypothetical protein EH165_00775 [Nakamurella antarctica]|uniref:Septum formation-related domain-containing protein n=1 Tax=Nakamurella antarctica TaxID=1902245 RepID=A0A3G8ZI77_9ACTN|nr:septum formation family protein [Nakamurella antarctica]AZI56920.1 hypothetical protein EH165_00775 [Nakamurella antarctica]
MNQRRAGGLVLVAALLAVAAISLIGQALRPVPGTASPVPVAGPPSVGDCLLAAPVHQEVPTQASDSAELRVDRVLQLSACSGSRFGEVYRVVESFTSVNQQLDLCAGLTDYTGWPLQRSSEFWSPAPSVSVTSSGPDDRQWAAGQRWVACVVMAGFYGSIASPVGRSLPEMPAAFATCYGTVEVPRFSPQVDCGGVHRMELFGTKSVIGAQQSQAQLDASCQTWAGMVTGMPEVTAGGQLTVHAVVIDPMDSQASVDPSSLADGQITFSMCTATPASDKQVLLGPLASLGSAPVPFG